MQRVTTQRTRIPSTMRSDMLHPCLAPLAAICSSMFLQLLQWQRNHVLIPSWSANFVSDVTSRLSAKLL